MNRANVAPAGWARSGAEATRLNGVAEKRVQVALLTAGRDKPYALGLGAALIEQGVETDFIGSDEVSARDLPQTPLLRGFNLRGDQSVEAGWLRKVTRVLAYYGRLLRYAVTARPRVFHILWHNKFEFLDRTLLMAFYRLLGKRLVFTAHNVNAGKRDGNDSIWNRWSLRCQYRLADHIFVHTEMMKGELQSEFGVSAEKISVIPFGINNTLPNTALTRGEARQRLGIEAEDKTILFFGNIAPYKGVEFLAQALTILLRKDPSYRLVIAGRPKGCEGYWSGIWEGLKENGTAERVIAKIEYIPDADVELYFKAAEVLVLPYAHIFQSGVLFLGYSFGLPVLATDVGSLKEEIEVGRTGFVCPPRDAAALARALEDYFQSPLYQGLEARRADIRAYANERYSWTTVGRRTKEVYAKLLGKGEAG